MATLPEQLEPNVPDLDVVDEFTQFQTEVNRFNLPIIEANGWNLYDSKVFPRAAYEGNSRGVVAGTTVRNGESQEVRVRRQPRYVLVWEETTDTYAMVRYGDVQEEMKAEWDLVKAEVEYRGGVILDYSHLLDWAKKQGETSLDVNAYVDYVRNTIHAAPKGSAYRVPV